jgi:hypothetical protein
MPIGVDKTIFIKLWKDEVEELAQDVFSQYV